jgi:hypothetical protein
VVLLDEVGLAEVSQNNPLKVLHALIEPDSRKQYTGSREFGELPYAVVGISNWELDAAKMNRAILLTRPEPGPDDLRKTAFKIMKTGQKLDDDKPLSKETERLLDAVADSYYEFREAQKKSPAILLKGSSTTRTAEAPTNFHGLRDYYSLVKCLTQTKELNPKPKVRRCSTRVLARFLSPSPQLRFLRAPAASALLRHAAAGRHIRCGAQLWRPPFDLDFQGQRQ